MILVATTLAITVWGSPLSWFSSPKSETVATEDVNPFGTPLLSRPPTLNIQATSSLPTAETFPTVNIIANPTRVASGKSTIITWSTINADYCVSSDADPAGWFFTAGAVNGSVQTLPLTADRTYVIRCMSADGGITTQSLAVAVIKPVLAIRTVTPTRNTTTRTTETTTTNTVNTVTTSNRTNPPPTLTLTASPLTVKHKGKTRLSWTSTNTTSCTAFGGVWSGSRQTWTPLEYSAELSGPFQYTFSLACTGPGGGVEKSVTITAQAPIQTTAQDCPWYGCWGNQSVVTPVNVVPPTGTNIPTNTGVTTPITQANHGDPGSGTGFWAPSGTTNRIVADPGGAGGSLSFAPGCLNGNSTNSSGTGCALDFFLFHNGMVASLVEGKVLMVRFKTVAIIRNPGDGSDETLRVAEKSGENSLPVKTWLSTNPRSNSNDVSEECKGLGSGGRTHEDSKGGSSNPIIQTGKVTNFNNSYEFLGNIVDNWGKICKLEPNTMYYFGMEVTNNAGGAIISNEGARLRIDHRGRNFLVPSPNVAQLEAAIDRGRRANAMAAARSQIVYHLSVDEKGVDVAKADRARELLVRIGSQGFGDPAKAQEEIALLNQLVYERYGTQDNVLILFGVGGAAQTDINI